MPTAPVLFELTSVSQNITTVHEIIDELERRLSFVLSPDDDLGKHKNAYKSGEERGSCELQRRLNACNLELVRMTARLNSIIIATQL